MLEIVAEIGINHDGDIAEAFSLIDLAKKSGAITAKFQLYDVKDLLAGEVPAAPYQARGLRRVNSITQNEFLQQCQMNDEFVGEIIDYCNTVEINFLCTGYNRGDFERLANFGCACVKLPSIAIKEPWTLLQAFSFFEYVIVSTGFSSIADLENLKRLMDDYQIDHSRMTICHCVSQYPADLADYNLCRLNLLRAMFPNARLGLSDHSLSNLPVNMAVGLGARFIEKHLTNNPEKFGADHHMSLSGSQFAIMALEANLSYQILGQSIRQEPTAAELENFKVMGRSPVFHDSISSNTVNHDYDLVSLRRPFNGEDNWLAFYENRRSQTSGSEG
ncbi:N-acetylneuraminate synthase family protein [Litoricolaceae bacterium]|nr:N-acetylneuraminate synthase family protein [Litorivicinaceae bacterium]